MILADNKPDSILIYSDWLIDNNQEALALKIREEIEVNIFTSTFGGGDGVGAQNSYFVVGTFASWRSIGSDCYTFDQVGIEYRNTVGYPANIGD